MAHTDSQHDLPGTQQLAAWVQKLRQQLMASFHRAAVVLSGDRLWCLTAAHELINAASCGEALWVSEHVYGALPPKKARTRLGREYDAIVFDLHDDFDPDALGAISGTLRGGGLLVLLIPELDQWQDKSASRFLQHAVLLMQNSAGVFVLQQGEACPGLADTVMSAVNTEQPEPPFRTKEQQEVVRFIVEGALDRQCRPVVLVSDRGRGKSSALGLVAGRLLRQGVGNIIVTAPRLSVTEPVFRHAQAMVPDAVAARGELMFRDARLRFMAPDALLDEQPQADLLLIDEAAAIPLHILERFLACYPQTVFATTIHGYEGTGRGFTLKFHKVLDEVAPGWHLLRMETPVRWAPDDPVEAWVDRLLCLDAELPGPAPVAEIDMRQCEVKLLDRDQLIQDEGLLGSLFALLVFAHYRTQPSDLKHMLEDVSVRIYTLEYSGKMLATALINEEGGYDESLSLKIYRGERRPVGNLLPQTLTFHAGCELASTLHYARIMRIAVHPELQGRGLGSHLLRGVTERERQQGMDAMGVSFGVTPELMRFWSRSGFELVRIGFTRDHASGTHAAVMLRPFTLQGEHLLDDVRTRFCHYLPSWLHGPLENLPDEMRHLLRRQAKQDVLEMHATDWKEVESFAYTHRGYEACMWPLYKLVANYASVVRQLAQTHREVIGARIQKGFAWPDVNRICRATGKRETVKRLRAAISELLARIQR